jgi:hypothetical protein
MRDLTLLALFLSHGVEMTAIHAAATHKERSIN